MKIISALLCLAISASSFAHTGEIVRVENMMYPSGDLDLYLNNIHQLSTELHEQAKDKCGKGNPVKLSNINFRVIGDFKSRGGTLNTVTYPILELTALLQCE